MVTPRRIYEYIRQGLQFCWLQLGFEHTYTGLRAAVRIMKTRVLRRWRHDRVVVWFVFPLITASWPLGMHAEVEERPIVVIKSIGKDSVGNYFVDTYTGYTGGHFAVTRVPHEKAGDRRPCGDGRFWLLERLPPQPQLVSRSTPTYSASNLFRYPIHDAIIEQASASIWEYEIDQRRERDTLDYCVYLITGQSIDNLHELRLVYFRAPYQSAKLKGPYVQSIMRWIGEFNQELRGSDRVE